MGFNSGLKGLMKDQCLYEVPTEFVKYCLDGVSNCTGVLCVISGFRHDVYDICALLGYCATNSGNFLPTLRDQP